MLHYMNRMSASQTYNGDKLEGLTNSTKFYKDDEDEKETTGSLVA